MLIDLKDFNLRDNIIAQLSDAYKYKHQNFVFEYNKRKNYREQKPKETRIIEENIENTLNLTDMEYVSSKGETKRKKIKSKVENLEKTVRQIVDFLGRIEKKIDNLLDEPNIPIAFSSYEDKDNAITELLKLRFPFEIIGFKCIYVTERIIKFLRSKGYKFKTINVDEYFSGKNRKLIAKEFNEFFDKTYGIKKKKTKKT